MAKKALVLATTRRSVDVDAWQWGWERTARGWTNKAGEEVVYVGAYHQMLGLPFGTSVYFGHLDTEDQHTAQFLRDANYLINSGRYIARPVDWPGESPPDSPPPPDGV